MVWNGDQDTTVRRASSSKHNRRQKVIVQRQAVRKDGWTQEVRARFLEVLGATANVRAATRAVGKGPAHAYALRKRDAGFAAQWDEALDLGYAELEMMLIRQSLFGTERNEMVRDGAGDHAKVKTSKTVHSFPLAIALRLYLAHSERVGRYRADRGIERPDDDAALARGANLCLVGGELLQFGTAVQTGPRRFRLSRLWRGRRGTEAAMAGHVASEGFLIVEAERLFVVPDAQVHMGADLSMIAIGIGDVEPAAAQCGVTGRALMPPAPVGLQAIDDGAGGLMLRWTRRSRAGWRWSDGVDAPLGEEREAYLVRVLNGGVPVRTAEVTDPSWPYAAAMIADDGGGPFTIEIRQIGSLALGQAAQIGI